LPLDPRALRPRAFTLGGSGARLALIVWVVSLALFPALVPREHAHAVDFADDRVAAKAGAERICYEAGAFAVLPHLHCDGDTFVRPSGTIVSGCHPLPPMFWPPMVAIYTLTIVLVASNPSLVWPALCAGPVCSSVGLLLPRARGQ
jgi:hypothetical protein